MGVVVNGIAGAVGVTRAYHIAKKERDHVQAGEMDDHDHARIVLKASVER